jgi:nitrogen fixation protein NifU and related proteins
MNNFYREEIFELYKNPINQGVMENPDLTLTRVNPFCGDEIRIDLKLDKGKLKDIKFSGKGCAISIASSSVLTEFVKNKSVKEIEKISYRDVLKLLKIDVSPSRVSCVSLCLDTLKNGLKNA